MSSHQNLKGFYLVRNIIITSGLIGTKVLYLFYCKFKKLFSIYLKKLN